MTWKVVIKVLGEVSMMITLLVYRGAITIICALGRIAGMARLSGWQEGVPKKNPAAVQAAGI